MHKDKVSEINKMAPNLIEINSSPKEMEINKAITVSESKCRSPLGDGSPLISLFAAFELPAIPGPIPVRQLFPINIYLAISAGMSEAR